MASTPLTLLAGADDRLQRLVDLLDPAALEKTTPCSGWNVRATLSHTLQTVAAFTAAAEGGEGPGEAEIFSGDDIVGTDPAGVAKTIVERSHHAWGLVDDWERTVTTALGPMPAGQAIAIVTFSTLVHSWDLATALGEQIEFTDDEVAVAEGVAQQIVPATRPAGLFAEEVEAPTDATPTQRVVALTGRSPV